MSLYERHSRTNRSFRKLLLIASLALVGSMAIGVAGAGADAADPILSSVTGTVAEHPDGSRTVTVQGAWEWSTHTSDCNQDKRAVGFAVDWSDTGQPGNVVTTLNGQTIAVGAASGNSDNAADNLVHQTGSGVDSTNPSVWRGGCGTYDQAAGYNNGTWGPISHTYSSSYTGLIKICALMYDVHLASNGGAPNGSPLGASNGLSFAEARASLICGAASRCAAAHSHRYSRRRRPVPMGES